MLREARLCLLGRTSLRQSVFAEWFSVRYNGIVFRKFQILRISHRVGNVRMEAKNPKKIRDLVPPSCSSILYAEE
jgi:hypothetical protein